MRTFTWPVSSIQRISWGEIQGKVLCQFTPILLKSSTKNYRELAEIDNCLTYTLVLGAQEFAQERVVLAEPSISTAIPYGTSHTFLKGLLTFWKDYVGILGIALQIQFN